MIVNRIPATSHFNWQKSSLTMPNFKTICVLVYVIVLIRSGNSANKTPCLQSCLYYEWMPLIDCQVTCQKGYVTVKTLDDLRQNCAYEKCNGNGTGTNLNQRDYVRCRKSCNKLKHEDLDELDTVQLKP
ncbi:hypothetical protein HDE_01367 [Halotydeus destructor]|nr:hypothetical protein HDE_01367 [Halotydeus destructor]